MLTLQLTEKYIVKSCSHCSPPVIKVEWLDAQLHGRALHQKHQLQAKICLPNAFSFFFKPKISEPTSQTQPQNCGLLLSPTVFRRRTVLSFRSRETTMRGLNPIPNGSKHGRNNYHKLRFVIWYKYLCSRHGSI